jgi:hypothetical protein
LTLSLSKLGKVFLLSFNAKNNQEKMREGVDAKWFSGSINESAGKISDSDIDL